MPSQCTIPLCPTKDRLLYTWPKENLLNRRWTQWVQKIRGRKWKPSGSTVICFHHFRSSDFSNYGQYSTGNSKILLLNREVAVPSIHIWQEDTESPSPSPQEPIIQDNEESSSFMDSIIQDNEESSSLMDSFIQDNESSSLMESIIQDCEENDSLQDSMIEDYEESHILQNLNSRSVSTQTESSIMPSVGSVKKLRSIGTQTITIKNPKICLNKEIQTTPTKRRRISSSNSEDYDDEDNQDEDNQDENNQDAMSDDYNPDDDPDIYNSDIEDDGEEEEESPASLMSDYSQEKGKRHKEPKYIVFHNQLLSLLAICLSCHSRNVEVTRTTRGSMLIAKIKCLSCKTIRSWQSQPYHEGSPVGNFLLSGTILFSGLSPIKVLRALKAISIQVIGESTFFTHQKKYLHKAIHKTWYRQRDTQLYDLQGESLVIGGDARFDSMGHSAKYGSYTTMNLETNQVLNVELIQSNEVKNSNAMELKGLQETLKLFHRFDMNIMSIVTDQHSEITKWLRKEEPDIEHYFDCWHIAKNLKKHINLLGKKTSCKLLIVWIKSVINHFYWSVMSTNINEGELIEAKWRSILRHVQNIHDGHGKMYPNCSHSELTDQDNREIKWLVPNTEAAERFEELVDKKAKVIRHASPYGQTCGVEGFHGVVNHFAPKMFHFSHNTMNSRLYLSAMHYNENSMRKPQKNRKGKVEYYIAFPKYKKGEPTLKTVMTSATFNYLDILFEETFIVIEKPNDYNDLNLDKIPPPLCSKYVRPDKEVLLKNKISRYQKN